MIMASIMDMITLVWDFNEELKNLQKKQLSCKIVRFWMEELNSIAYDAEDVLDEYSYEVICNREKEEEYNKSTVFNKVRKVFSSSKLIANWKLAHKVNKLNEKFNKIAKRKNDLGLLKIDVVGSSSQHELMMKNRETDSLVVTDWKFVGRDNDKSTIIKMLLEENSCNNNQSGGSKHVSVIPIVGMGGLGKTTMAQHVYNDEAVKKHFELKIWICVSVPFDIKKLWKNITNSIGIAKQHDDATWSTDDLSHMLQDAFRGKKFILVLDDVWNENHAYWYEFKKPFMVGAEGSKILVTTRSVKVAELMEDKFPHYELGILKENDCWNLFKEIAFGSMVGAEETSNLVEIGKEMVKRCGGLPFAVVFLGSLMLLKKKEEEWKIIRDTKLWNESPEEKNSEILSSLRLSYDYLPSHLKLCFSYCCLFPKDSEIQREKLIRLWMAEGFLIETSGENTMSMEEIGNKYFDSLLSSFFFQDVKKDEDGDIETYKMHGLVHDLARSVVGKNDCLIVENAHDIDYISKETRRLNLSVDLDDGDMLAKVIEALKRAKNLRTVFVCQQRIIPFDIGNAFKENKRLRVLDLSGSESFDVTTESTSSSSIGGLKHLRYLGLPEEFIIPKGISRLRFLQTLGLFNVGDKKKKKNKNGCGIEELEGLNLLRGYLRIGNLENVRSGTDACRANLKEKKNLRMLSLSWNTRYDDAISNDEAVLEGLRPHPNLRYLWINGFQGSKLPKWIQDSSCLPNLVELILDDGIYIEQVAGFGALPSLKSLTLRSMKKLKCIGNEFYYSNNIAATTTTTTAFPSLKELTLLGMQSLKEWVVPSLSTTWATYCFPLLEEITIDDCPLLSTITPTTIIFPSLKVLYLRNIDGSAVETLVTNNIKTLTTLRLCDIRKLISLPRQGLMENNNTLLSLHIEDCYEFEGFFSPNKDDDDDEDQEGGGQQQLQQMSQVVSSSSCSSSLQSLKVYRCPALRFYPNIRSLTSLRSLEIQHCKISKSLQDELTCLSSSLEHLEHVKF